MGTSEDAGSPRDKLQLAWQLFVSIEYQVQVADRKVQAIFGANALLVAALSFYGQNTLTRLRQDGITALEAVGLAASALLLLSVCASAAFAILALLPRVRLSSSSRSSFFFGDIAAVSGEQFIGDFLSASVPEATREILAQVHLASQVVAEKYRWTRRAAATLTVSLLLWAIVLLVRFVS